MAYDPAEGAVVFFGGSYPGPGYPLPTNQTWEFQAGRWKDLNISGPPLTIAGVETMSFDVTSQSLIDLVAPASFLSGNTSPPYEDWEFAAGNWTNQTPQYSPIPPVGYNPLSAWDVADNYWLYTTGGLGGQTWAFGRVALSAQLSVFPAPVDVGVATTIRVIATGGVPLLQYSYPQLPPGCSGTSASELSCTPNLSGFFSIRASVTDSDHVMVNVSGSLDVGSRFTATGPLVSSDQAYVGDEVAFSVVTSGGIPPYSFSWSGVPANCSLPDLPAFNCMATVLGPAHVSVLVSDATGAGNVTVGSNLTVVQEPQVTSFVSAPGLLEAGDALSFNATVVGGALPLSFSYAGLPAGCASSNTSSLGCHPSSAGDFNTTLSVLDALGTVVESTVSTVIVPLLTFRGENITPNPATVGASVAFSYALTGGRTPFHAQWTGLPPGCSPIQGSFACTMNASGSFVVGLTVRDALGHTVDSNVSLEVFAGGSVPGNPSPFGSVSVWTWGILGAGVVGLVGLGVWGLSRRRPPEEPGVPTEDTPTEDSGLD
jgi:hypothetical protein